MKPHLSIAHTGTLGDENRTAMTFDENAIAHLMSVLTDLYSDPALAVIREYSTNALDSHVAAGNTAPIEVTLPSAMAPVFRVKDYGVGMSADQINEQFSKYGWSSKQDSDEAVGMLGLGCKSGLSYTSQFTLTCIQDGVRILVLVTRMENGAGAVQILASEATDEPNGVEVEVPVSRVNEFCSKARTFFEYWEPGTIVINSGNKINYVMDLPEMLRLDPDVVIFDHATATRLGIGSTVIMGNVPYPVSSKYAGYGTSAYFIARVPIGSVNFTPSREALHYTKRTEATIVTIQEFVNERAARIAQAKIDAAANHTEALRRFRDLQRWTKRATYKGIKIPLALYPTTEVDSNGKEFKTDFLRLSVCEETRYGMKDQSQPADWLDPENVVNNVRLIVTGHTGKSLRANMKPKSRQWCQDHGFKDGKIIFTHLPFGAPWVEDIPTITVEELKAIRLSGAAPTTARGPRLTNYAVLDVNANVTYIDYKKGDGLAWAVECWTEAGKLVGGNRLDVCQYAGNHTVALVAKAKVDWFQQTFPGVPTLDAWLKDRVNAHLTSHSEWDLYFNRVEDHVNEFDIFYPKCLNSLLDRDLANLITAYKEARIEHRAKTSDSDRLAAAAYAAGLRNKWDATGTCKPLARKIKAALKQYPLLSHMRSYNLQQKHLVEYVNSMYIIRQGLHLVPA